nr:hypothetical protein [Tanacetum cinerariifolium]
MFHEMMQQLFALDREAKIEEIRNEAREKGNLLKAQTGNEDMKILESTQTGWIRIMLVQMNVSSDEEECVTIPEFVDVQVVGDDNVVIKSLSTDVPFLNKLVGNGNFIGTLIDRNPPLEGSYVEEADPEEDILDMKYKQDKQHKYHGKVTTFSFVCHVQIPWLNWRRNEQDHDSTPTILKKFQTVAGDDVANHKRRASGSFKRRRQGFPDGVRT